MVLHASQLTLLHFVHEFGRAWWIAPSIEQIAAHLQVRAATAYAMVLELVSKGILEMSPGRPHTLRITDWGQQVHWVTARHGLRQAS